MYHSLDPRYVIALYYIGTAGVLLVLGHYKVC